jgi:phospholipid transport system substrate-binding protein
MNRILKAASLLLLTSGLSYTGENITDLIMNKEKLLQTALKTYRTNPVAANKENVITLINSIFDFQLMGQKVLPKSVWDGSDKTERENFINEFKRMIELSSIKQLEVYQSDSAVYDPPIIDTSKAAQTEHVWIKGRKATLQYKMVKVGNQWKAYDLIIDEMSTIKTYKEQFTEFLKNKKLVELTDLLKKKADSNSN